MAYTAFEEMRKANQARFGVDAGPWQPPLYPGAVDRMDLKGAALRFLRDRCEQLRFDQAAADAEKNTGVFQGKSYSDGQVPYNMQMDIDRLCLEKSLETFIDSGIAEDAYNIYYCYLEMFFGRYGRSKKMVELLSEYESNGSSLLMKHRDHYSHSVYVFALGLALYETCAPYRDAFRRFYHLTDKPDNEAANRFLELWGLTALFHDIGYPFELPFEQVMSYYEVRGQKRGKGSLLFSYRELDGLIGLDDRARAHFAAPALYGREFATTNALFAHDIYEKLGQHYHFSEDYLLDVLNRKPEKPENFNYFMDHAFFSAARLFRELADALGVEGISKEYVDALSAILLHNSLFKFSIAYYKEKNDPLPMALHPLAWLLMCCDELQCWDRTSYGRNSRKELHPMAADFDFSKDAIHAVYYFDSDEEDKILAFKASLAQWQKETHGKDEKAPRLKDYSDMAVDDQFAADIRRIVDTAQIPLSVEVKTRPADYANKKTYLSDSNFLHLCDFAAALNGRYAHEGKEDSVSAEQLEAEFEQLSLEYKLSNINQVKSFSKYLNAIHCFYTDRPVDFDMLKAFTPDQTAVIGPMEHERWLREHQAMGWHHGSLYDTVPVPPGENESSYRKTIRERTRCHLLAMDGPLTEDAIRRHYDALPENEKGKDYLPFNSMLKLIKKFDGLRLYVL